MPGGEPHSIATVPNDHSGTDHLACGAAIRCGAAHCFIREQIGDEVVFSLFDPATATRGARVMATPPTRLIESWDVAYDDSLLMFTRQSGGTRTVVVVSANGVERAPAFPPLPHDERAWNVAASRDGKRAYVASYDTGQSVVWQLEANASPKRLWSTPSEVTPIAVSPDGARLALDVQPSDNDVWLIEPR
jgi:Tol biopolymer transport system component